MKSLERQHKRHLKAVHKEAAERPAGRRSSFASSACPI